MNGYAVKQSSTAQPLVFLMIDSTGHITGVTGLSPTVTISKSGGAFATPAGAVTEIGNGWYKVAGNATDTATLGPLLLHATGTGADPVDVQYSVVAYDPQDAVRAGLTALPNAAADAAGGLVISDAGGLDIDAILADTNQLQSVLVPDTGTVVSASSTTAFTTDLPLASDIYTHQLIHFTSGTCAGQTQLISAFTAPGAVTVADAFVSAPQNGDAFTLINYHAYPVASIQANLASQASVDVIDGNVDAILLDTGTDGVVVATGSKSGYSLTATTGLGNQTSNITGMVSGNSTHSATDVWAAAARTLTANTNLNDPTAAAIADAVWDEVISGHATVGSTGAALSAAGGSGDPWATALPGAYGAGTAGEILGDWKNAGRLDAILDTIAADTTTDIPTLINALNDISIADIGTALATYDGPTNAEMVAAFTEVKGATWASTDTLEAIRDRGDAAWVTATGFATPTNITAGTITTVTNLTNLPAGVQTSITNIEADTNELQTDDIPTLIAALPTAAEIFTAVVTTALTEAYAADGSPPTLAQAIFLIQQALTEFSIAGTTTTIKKIDGSTTAATLTLNDGTTPTAVTRAT